MKAIITLITLFFSIATFGQNIDWINAPMNPIPLGADLKYHNLKGNVFQGNILNYFTRDGKWFSFTGKEVLKKDAQGRIVQYIDDRGNIDMYQYDSKGNLVVSSGSTYEYDNKNRLIKANHQYETSQYNYKNQGDLLVITELNTYDGKTSELEHHYKNGLKILLKSKSGETFKYEYEFDEKGNWISMNIIDVATNKTLLNQYTGKPLKPTLRNIIYYSDYDKGLSAITVQLKDVTEGRIANAPLIAYPLINGKVLEKQFIARLIDDYIFYEPMANTYYIARNAFLKTNKFGQKFPVEKLISGKENILLYNGMNIRVVEKGKSGEDANDWKTINYTEALNSFVSVNQKLGTAYAFENVPTVTDGKTVAIVGKPISGAWFVTTNNGNGVYIFENGHFVAGKYSIAGFLVNTDVPVIAIEGKKEYYVLTDYDNAIDKNFSKARLYDPKTDKTQLQKASLSNNTSTNQTTTTTTGSVLAPFTDKKPLYFKKVSNVQVQFYQEETKILPPNQFFISKSGDLIAFYEPRFYFIFPDAKNVALNTNVTPKYKFGNDFFYEVLSTSEIYVNRKGKYLNSQDYKFYMGANGVLNFMFPQADLTYISNMENGPLYEKYYGGGKFDGTDYLDIKKDKSFDLIRRGIRIPKSDYEVKVDPTNDNKAYIYYKGKKEFEIPYYKSFFDQAYLRPINRVK